MEDWRVRHEESIARTECRLATNRALTAGLIKKSEVCEKCGEPHVECHHNDYGNPLDVQWLCYPCHLEVHGCKAKLKHRGEKNNAEACEETETPKTKGGKRGRPSTGSAGVNIFLRMSADLREQLEAARGELSLSAHCREILAAHCRPANH